jgi:hypothetical protein
MEGTTALKAEPLVDALDQLDRVLETALAEVATANDGALVGGTRRLAAVRARFEALWCSVVSETDRRQIAQQHGVRDTGAWLAMECGERPGDVKRDLEIASRLDELPVVAEALRSGTLSKAKVAELSRMDGASADEQAEMIARARTASVQQTAHAVTRWTVEHEVAAVPTRSEVSLTDADGALRISGTLIAEDAEFIQVATDVAADALCTEGLTGAQRRAAGLVAVCRYFLEHHDQPVTDRRGRPNLTVTVDVETLERRAGRAAVLDSGRVIAAADARRLACDAGVTRVITGPDSMPLDVGRRSRSPSPAQATAVVHRDQHCRWLGCVSPPWSCEVHHLEHWADGGPTNLDNLALICWHHHQLIHARDLGAAETREHLRPVPVARPRSQTQAPAAPRTLEESLVGAHG